METVDALNRRFDRGAASIGSVSNQVGRGPRRQARAEIATLHDEARRDTCYEGVGVARPLTQCAQSTRPLSAAHALPKSRPEKTWRRIR